MYFFKKRYHLKSSSFSITLIKVPAEALEGIASDSEFYDEDYYHHSGSGDYSGGYSGSGSDYSGSGLQSGDEEIDMSRRSSTTVTYKVAMDKLTLKNI